MVAVSESESELERNLGFWEAMTLGGGTMIGAGIFILPGIAAEGAGPASSVSFAIAGSVALLAAVSLSELATGMPIAGGSYHYVNRGLGSLFGSIVGWGMWTGLMFASAFYMIGFGQYIVEPVPFLDGRVLIVLFGLFGLSLIVGINYYGTEESGSAQNYMIGAEFVVVLIYTFVGLFFIETANLADFAPTGAGGVVATTGTVFVTFLGFEIIATVAGEIEDPGRLIPLTMILSVVAVTLLYVVIMIVSTGVIPYQSLGESLVPVSDVAAVYLGTAGVVAVVVAAAVAAISSSNSSVLAASRVIFAMGRDSLMSQWLSVTHDRFNTPHRAILVTGAVTGLLVALGLEVAAIVALLAEVASFSFLVSYALVHVALVAFRYVDPPAYDPDFRVPDPLFPAVPVAGVLAAFVVISQMATVVLVVGAGIITLGVIWYLVYARSRDTETGLVQEAYRERSVDYTVVVPVANPDTQRGLLRLAAAAARTGADGGRAELVAVNVLQVADDSPRQNVEAGRIDHQRELLAGAREAAAGFDVELRTEAVVGEHVGEATLEVLDAEEPDEALLGWRGTLTRGQFVFGSNLDAVVERAPCDLSLINVRGETVGQPVALAGPGPHTPVAARRAAAFATVDDTVPVLLNVQEPGDRAQERGEAAIREVAEAADLNEGEYEPRVVVADDTEAGILEAVVDYETVCVGLSEKSPQTRVELGSVAERISEAVPANVAIVRGTRAERPRKQVAVPPSER